MGSFLTFDNNFLETVSKIEKFDLKWNKYTKTTLKWLCPPYGHPEMIVY